MIKRILYDGHPKDDTTKQLVNQHLDTLVKDNETYIIGIDYATEGYEDHTTIARYMENKDGTTTLVGIDLL